MLEIERKFLVDKLSFDIASLFHERIIQGYLSIKRYQEERIRKKGEKYSFAKKTGDGLLRREQEREISKEEFDLLWPSTKNARIEKIRYLFLYGNRTIEIDVFEGRLKGLITAEVEFNSENEAEKFQVPEWFGREVTVDKRYKNKSLALYGKPA